MAGIGRDREWYRRERYIECDDSSGWPEDGSRLGKEALVIQEQ